MELMQFLIFERAVLCNSLQNPNPMNKKNNCRYMGENKIGLVELGNDDRVSLKNKFAIVG